MAHKEHYTQISLLDRESVASLSRPYDDPQVANFPFTWSYQYEDHKVHEIHDSNKSQADDEGERRVQRRVVWITLPSSVVTFDEPVTTKVSDV